MKILLNKQRGKKNTNVENNVCIDITSNSRLLPIETINENVNSYEQYISEKKKSQIYRFSFEINPICTNVLFNNISEIVYREGSDDCVVFNNNGLDGNIKKNDNNIIEYCNYKGINKSDLNRFEMIRDTSFSHPDIGGIVYHCGYDIFNNHTLRKKEFNLVNKLSNKSVVKKYFNTILDYQRDYEGSVVEDYSHEFNGEKKKFNKHLYQIDNVLTFEESINENLIEQNGWVGFINPTSLNISNYITKDKMISLNKCMNNNKACEMIDMYPDRSLYSFIPKINKYRGNRVEKNWDYCLTYPCENVYNDIVQYESEDGVKINGLECTIVDNLFEIDNYGGEYVNYNEGSYVTLKTFIKNNFNVNSVVNFVLIGEINGVEKIIYLDNNERIVGLGIDGKNKEYYFKVYCDNLFEILNNFTKPSKVQIRVRKVIEGGVCNYYFRNFKRLPNFKNTDVYLDEYVTKEDIDKYNNINFNSTLNALGFSRTIYNDRNAQILFNDDVNLKGLKDNLGRELSEIYLTIVKTNKGNKEWYDDKNYTSQNITYSHCFGEITSGLDILDADKIDYNIHKIHNIDTKILTLFDEKINEDYKRWFKKEQNNGKITYKQPEVLERDININGVNGSGTFLGDIVEFNKFSLVENILEDVYHRFNTMQREIIDDEYSKITIDDIVSDDYDIGHNMFSSVTRNYGTVYETMELPININPEGYYYKPHYKIVLKEYGEKIMQGKHTLLNVLSCNINKKNDYVITVAKNYFFEPLEKIYLYNRYNNERYVTEILDISGQNSNIITIKNVLKDGETINDFILYKYNSEKPNVAYELNDGSGRYLWREFKEDYEYTINNQILDYVFTNNAHYINKKIIFYLLRQDPTGKYNLNNIKSIFPIISNLCVEGDVNDYSNIETSLNDLEESLC